MRCQVAALAFLAGCATHSGVVPAGDGTHRITAQAATGISGMGNLTPDAMREATDHCAQSGEAMHIVQLTETKPPYIFGNYPKVDLTFSCVPK